MTPKTWQQVKDLFQAAVERAPDARSAFLDDACNGDEELRREVLSLIDFDSEAAGFIEQPAIAGVPELLAKTSTASFEGRRIGHYQLLKEIGHGGMGVVYLAQREDDQFRQSVAIKLIKRGLDTEDILRRFRNERQILASLNHPHIAKLFDGGTTEDGLPYFVMEYIEGLPLLQYCDEHDLSTSERLQVFRNVCAAVQHAHQNLVIHRDLKPSNVLVTGAGELKLLDFGVAKFLNPEFGAPGQTQTMFRVMTPEYASPEQVRGQHVTTATDVYSLGVILYELLTDTRPYNLRDTSPEELSRAICDSEPAKPSESLRDTGTRGHGDTEKEESLANVAASPRPRVSVSGLRGDLDNIVLKALRKEPVRRYQSVEQFSEDIRRHLEGLPVSARPDTFAYRGSKFIQRHRVGVAAAALVALALIAGIVATTWQARVARNERDNARIEQAKAERINAFLQDMLGAAAPEVKGADIKVVEVLDEASSRAKKELADKPEVMADVLMTLGRTYISLGKYVQAESDLRAALDASLKANGEKHPSTATTMGWLGLALAYQNKPAEGETVSRRAVELHREIDPKGIQNLGVALYSLGFNLIQKGEAKAAEPFLQEAVVVIKKHLGEKHGYYMATLTMLGYAREGSGDLDGAESLYRQVIDLGRGVENRYRVYIAQSSARLGVLLMNKGNYAEAESLFRESESIYRETSGDSNSSVGIVKMNFGRLYFLKGDYVKAEEVYRQALDLLRKDLAPENPFTVTTAVALGLTLTRAGKPAEGEAYLREALEIRKKVLPQGDVQIPMTESALGECLTAQRRYAEAETLLLESYNALKSSQGERQPRTIEARTRLIKLYEAWRKPKKAEQYKSS